jgi:hypothetical protein
MDQQHEAVDKVLLGASSAPTGETTTEATVPVVGDTEILPTNYVLVPRKASKAVHIPILNWSTEDIIANTQESTGRTPFPEVYLSFPEYLQSEFEVDEECDSSGSEWLGQPDDFWESEDEIDFGDGSIDNECREEDQPFEEWCHSDESYRVYTLRDKGLTELYDEGNWGSENVKLRGVPISFLGPKPGANLPKCHYLPTPFRTFNLFWGPSILWEICVETNRYAARCNSGMLYSIQHSPWPAARGCCEATQGST